MYTLGLPKTFRRARKHTADTCFLTGVSNNCFIGYFCQDLQASGNTCSITWPRTAVKVMSQMSPLFRVNVKVKFGTRPLLHIHGATMLPWIQARGPYVNLQRTEVCGWRHTRCSGEVDRSGILLPRGQPLASRRHIALSFYLAYLTANSTVLTY